MSYCLLVLNVYLRGMRSKFRASKRQGRFGKAFRKGARKQRSNVKRMSNYRIARGGLRL